MDEAGKIADQLANNPYIRLKSFSVNVSISPSLNLEFEMKGAQGVGGTARQP
jgi:hypothetical protein